MAEGPVWLSVVSPVYQAEGCVEELCQRVIDTVGPLAEGRAFEIVLVDDASRDGSWAKVREIARREPCVRGLRLTRNFGQHRAIPAGLAAARGEVVVVLDCDLQDPPEEIPRLLEALDDAVDVVLVRRTGRQGPWLRSVFSRLFFRVLNLLSQRFAPDQVGTFSAMRREVARQYLEVADPRSHFLSVLGWMGFPHHILDVPHAARFAGRSSYSLRKLFRHAIDGLVTQTTVLLQLSTAAGAALFGLSLVLIGYLTYRRLTDSVGVDGWVSVMVAVLFVGGSVLLSLGVLGLYLAQVVESSRGRPLYLVQQRTWVDPAE